MGYIIAYLLFAVVVDLLLEVIDPERHRRTTTIAIHRRLWNDSLFDCRSRGYLTDAPTLRRTHRRLAVPSKG